MKTFQFHPGNASTVLITACRKAPAVCVKMVARLLTTMAWAVAMILIMIVLAMMLFAKTMI